MKKISTERLRDYNMSINCQIPTPSKYVKQLLDLAGYKEDLYGKRVLENSCGEGNVLCDIVERYLKDSFSRGYDINKIKAGLQRDIVAYEVDEEKISDCEKRLNTLCRQYGVTKVNWSIRHMDYLMSPEEKFDFVVGNPPYITYHDMSVKQREYLRKIFKSCKIGRFDYCYAFIEKSLESLLDNGVFTYLIPYGVLRNQFANNIRLQILPILTDIYDYGGISVFEDVISSSVVIVCKNGVNNNSFVYHGMVSNAKRLIAKNSLGKKWFFDTMIKKGERFGDFYDVMNSVATLYNKAFVINDYTADDKYVYFDGNKIEKGVVYRAVSAKKKRRIKKDEVIIFPYEINNNTIVCFSSEKSFQDKYPFAYAYLKKFIKPLNKRKSSKNVKWFEYGRTQALKQIIGKKIVMSQVVTRKVNIYMCDKLEIPYAGYFIKVKDDNHTLEQAKKILESKDFFEYVRSHGTPTTSVSYRISVKEILDYMY